MNMKQRLTTHLLLVFSALHLFTFSTRAQGTYPVFPNIMDHGLASGAVLLGASGNRLVYFDVVSGKNKLWLSDGTPVGTKQVSPTSQSEIQVFYHDAVAWYFTEKRGSTYYISMLTPDMDTLVPLHNSGISYQDILFWKGKFAWIQNSGSSGYSRLQLYDPADLSLVTLLNLEYLDLRALGGSDSLLFFIASTDAGMMLGSSEGTLSSTKYITTLYPAGNSFDQQSRFFSNGDKVYFFYHPEPDPFVLWSTDGTQAGTVELGLFQNPDFGWPADPAIFLEEKLFFILRELGAPSGTTFELHVSDGTPAGTLTLDDNPNSYTEPSHLTLFNNKIYYISDYFGAELRETDGTLAGTKVVLDAFGHQSGGFGVITTLGKFENDLMVQAYTYANGSELYRCDGTQNGTYLLSDVIRGPASGDPNQFTEVNGRMFFTARYANKERLWIYYPAFSPSCDSFLIDTVMVQAVTDSALGTVNMTIAGGQQPYVFSLNGGTNTYNSTFNDLPAGVYDLQVTDNLGCVLETTVIVDETSSVARPDLVKSLTVSPNPSTLHQGIYVALEMADGKVAEPVSLSVYSLKGKVHYQQTLANTHAVINHRIGTRDWPWGQYILILRAGQTILATVTLVIQ